MMAAAETSPTSSASSPSRRAGTVKTAMTSPAKASPTSALSPRMRATATTTRT